jgi:hypothetical protein
VWKRLRFAKRHVEVTAKRDVSDSQLGGVRRPQLPRVLMGAVAVLMVAALVLATQVSSSASVKLRRERSVDGLTIRLPQGWPIESDHSCATNVSSVLINVPADWQEVQCPDAGDEFAMTIRIGHFSLKYGCCVSKTMSKIGGRSASELRFSNGLTYGVEWTNPITSVEFDCAPYGELTRAELQRDKAIVRSVLGSVRVN